MNRRCVTREAALALVCIAGVWPLVEISKAALVGAPVAGGAFVAWLIGALARSQRVHSALIVAAQAFAVVTASLVVLAIHGVSLAPGAIDGAMRDGLSTANGSVAPLPAIPGVIALLTLGSGLVALVTDFVGGTSRMAALTALPIAAPVVLATTALGTTLPITYFLVMASAWALLVWVDHARSDRLIRSAPAFAVMTATALVGSITLASHVPSRATPALAQGGARGMNTTVDFSDTLDLSKDLTSKNSAPVLIYTTDDSSPEPLRVTTSSTYRDGEWRASTTAPVTHVDAQETFPSLGYDPSVPAESHRTTVSLNAMRAPLVAAPSPLVAANFGASLPSFEVVSATGVPHLSKPSLAYSVISRSLTAAARPTSEEPVNVGGSVTAADLDVSSLPAAALAREKALVSASGASGSQFDRAVTVQDHLRTDPSFTYSLTLAPTRVVDGQRLDPLSNFLETRQGYCTQFATALVMAARTLGIPAHLAIGFLPGTRTANGEYAVRASDAHAWAELFFPGMGWTRFDPTPGSRSGAAPAYAPEKGSTAATSTSAPAMSTSVQPRTHSVASSAPASSTSTSHTSAATPHHTSSSLGRIVAWLGLLLLVIAACAVIPLRGRRRREELLRRASNARELDEGHWHRMLWCLRDLGYTVSTGRSPRDSARAFAADNPQASPALREAFERAASGVEHSRYASSATRTLASATDRVVRTARQDAGLPARLGAWLLPRSGRSSQI